MENQLNTNHKVGGAAGTQLASNGEFNVREFLDFLWRLRYYIVGCVAFAILVAFVIIRIQTPVYRQSTWIRLNRGDDAASEMALLRDITGSRTGKKVDNEVFILQSPSMMCNVVEKLGLDYKYYSYGAPIAASLDIVDRIFGYKKTDLYKNAPFELVLERESAPEAPEISSLEIDFRHKSDKVFEIREFTINGTAIVKYYGEHKYGETFIFDGGNAVINVKNASAMNADRRYNCSWRKPYAVASSMVNSLTVEVQRDKKSYAYNSPDVIAISYSDVNISRAKDVLNTLVAVANNEARDYANIAGMRALDFINTRLEALSQDLLDAESSYQNYRSSSALIDVSSQSNYVLTSDQRNKDRLDEVEFQLQVLQMIQDCMNEQPQGVYASVPANVGVSDPGLNSVITAYNTLVVERERMVANSSENNPRVQTVNTQLDVQKRSIQTSLTNLVRVYENKQQDVRRNISVGKQQLSNIPRQELHIQQLGRKLNVIEPLYLLLQQKKEETQIAISSQADNYRVIEAAFGSTAPISPQQSKIYLIAMLLGLCLPMGLSWLRINLRSTVETKVDIEDNTSVPVLAVISSMEVENRKKISAGSGGRSALIAEGRNSCTESFGMLRTNLRYLTGAKVIQVTSSVPGEGKSFVSSNLALSIARLDRKVLLIGMDIRKPALGKIFKKDISNVRGTVVSYLIGKTKNLDDLTVSSGVYPCLDIIFAGPSAPNPLELISNADLKSFFDHFRDKYDYIIVDSAPFLPVVDSLIINTYVDATLFVVRADFTALKVVRQFKDILENPGQPVNNVNIVLNDVNYSALKYQYSYGKGYGYGYGYGYGSRYGYGRGYGYGYGYGEETSKHSKHKKSSDSAKHI